MLALYKGYKYEPTDDNPLGGLCESELFVLVGCQESHHY